MDAFLLITYWWKFVNTSSNLLPILPKFSTIFNGDSYFRLAIFNGVIGYPKWWVVGRNYNFQLEILKFSDHFWVVRKCEISSCVVKHECLFDYFLLTIMVC